VTTTHILPSENEFRSALSDYVDNWPKNPFTDAPMTEGTDAGDYSYNSYNSYGDDSGSSYYSLTGYGRLWPRDNLCS